jgi:hypothetical protein
MMSLPLLIILPLHDIESSRACQEASTGTSIEIKPQVTDLQRRALARPEASHCGYYRGEPIPQLHQRAEI